MHEEKCKLEVSDEVDNIVILLKGNNQGSIALAYNSVFYFKTKYIDI